MALEPPHRPRVDVLEHRLQLISRRRRRGLEPQGVVLLPLPVAAVNVDAIDDEDVKVGVNVLRRARSVLPAARAIQSRRSLP
jgi:hypothetical protein